MIYAPYFGLDIETLRKWFETQFTTDMGWESFGKTWQFDHIVPVNCFDFTVETDLKMCWSFVNIRVKAIQSENDPASWMDMVAARGYFKSLYDTTRYEPCNHLLQKIDTLEKSDPTNAEKQVAFILLHAPYLSAIENYSAFEFDLLNNGRTVDEVVKETSFLRKF